MLGIEKLDKKQHDRDSFTSKNDELNNYLKKYANQDQKANRAMVYLAVRKEDKIPKYIYGYFSLNSFCIFNNDDINLSFTPYRYKPAILIGRLAIDSKQNILKGHQLLWQALKICLDVGNVIGVSIIAVDPINDIAKNFYLRQGFQQISPNCNQLFTSLHYIAEVLAKAALIETELEIV